MYQNVFDHQNNPQQNYNNSSQVFPLSPSNYAYKKESPINYTNFPSNMSPRNVYEQYSMPVAYPNEQPQFFERSPPLPILNPITKIPLPIDNQKIYIQSPRITNRNNVNQIQQKGIMRSSGHLLPAKEPKYSVMRSDSPNRKMRSSAHIIPLKDSQNTIMRSSYQYIPVEDIQRTIIKPPTNFIPVREIITSPSRILTPRNNNDELFVNLKVEIERLSFLLKEKEEELNSFKAKCLHLEAHLTVEKMPSPNNHRIQELENKLNLLLLENQKLNHLLNEKNIEIESWRSRMTHNELAFHDAKILSARIKDLELRNGSLLEELEKWKLNFYDIDRVRAKDEHLKRSAFKEKETAEFEIKNLRNLVTIRDGELEEMRFKFKQMENHNRDGRGLEQKLVTVSGDYEKLQRMYQEKNKDYELMKQKHYQLETYLHDHKLKENRSIENENRLALLSSEITRLNVLMKERIEEIEIWRSKYSKLEYSTKEINVFENELKRTRELLELRNREVQEWKSKTIKYESSLTEMKSSQFRSKEYEERINIYLADIERLNYTIRSKNQEIERLEYTINHRQGLDKEILALKEINEIRLKEIEDMKIKCIRFEESSLDSRNKQHILIEYENKITLLSTELERLNHVLRIKSEEIENWKIKSSRINYGGDYEENRDLETKINVLSVEIQRLNIIIEAQRREINQSRLSMHSNGIVINKNFEQNEFIGALTRENDDLRRSLYEKEEEIDVIQRNKFGYI